ncbi:hypothetical protein CK203_049862 [Vitis vinifera]|uniref:Copia protein n=1 Tax=Vitis vinifera TaxID=29760 RepID=A0A438GVX4_VITVI|nr:hypothetical protein CK203_049862 [Vitis vinifera]
MKNLGELKYFLGIEVARSKRDFEIFEVIPGKGLMFSKTDHLRVKGYTDVDWAGTSRIGNPPQATSLLLEETWRLLTEIGFAPDSEMKLFCDNKAAIDISHNPIQHDRTKHVEVDRHFIKQNLDAKIIRFPFVKSEDQLADILTKAEWLWISLRLWTFLKGIDPVFLLFFGKQPVEEVLNPSSLIFYKQPYPVWKLADITFMYECPILESHECHELQSNHLPLSMVSQGDAQSQSSWHQLLCTPLFNSSINFTCHIYMDYPFVASA